MTNSNTWTNVAIGAAITIGLSFTGFSPLLGGGVAGYLQKESPERGAKVGAISGVIATIPIFLVLFLGLVLFAGIPATSIGAPGGLGLAVISLLVLPMLVVWFVGLSAVGGYLGGYIHTDFQPQTGTDTVADR